MTVGTKNKPKIRKRERFVDALGIAFDDHRLWLPDSVADWPNVKSIKDRRVVSHWRSEWAWTSCWWCDKSTREDADGQLFAGTLHHLARYDIPTCFAWLCNGCHIQNGEAVRSESLGRLLYLKWYHNCGNLSWIHIALSHGKHLPELEAKQ